MHDQLGSIVFKGMNNQLPIEYQVLLNHTRSYLFDYLLSETYNRLLLKEPNTWTTFLDRFVQWLIKKRHQSLDGIFPSICKFKVKDFDYSQNFDTWKQVFDNYFTIIKQSFPSPNSIETLQQLYILKNLANPFEMNEIVIQATGKIANFITGDKFNHMFWRENLFAGMRGSMTELIKTWPALDPFLEAVSNSPIQHIIQFLELLWKINYCCDDLTIVELFLDYLKKEGKLKMFVRNFAHYMKLLVDVVSKDFEEICKAEELFIWIKETGVPTEIPLLRRFK